MIEGRMHWESGMKVVHRSQRGWGVGLVIEVFDEGRRLAVRFAGRDGVTVVSGRDPALRAVPEDTPLEEVRAPGPLDAIMSGQGETLAAFRLRARVARLEALRRADSLGALLSSRVHVLPHQVGAAGRILSDRVPRFILADEVGLGKTVEAGLVFAGMRQVGLAERVLVIVPEHLAFQWLAELFHKFNSLFSLLTGERIDEMGGAEAALARSPLAIVPLERLREDPGIVEVATDLPLDLVIVDEAHHLADDALYRALEPIARTSFGLLLLTATPVRLDPREYFRLLGLVEPVPSATFETFLRRLARHEQYVELAKSILACDDTGAAVARLHEMEPDDPLFARSLPPGRDALLAHLADHYSLSTRLIRNRRVRVGAFTERQEQRHDVPAGGKIEAAAALCARLADGGEKALVFHSDPQALEDARVAIARKGREALLYEEEGTIEARDRLVARFRDPDGPMVLLCGESGGEGRNFQFACHLVCLDLPDSPLALEQRIGRLDRLGQHRSVQIHVLVEPGEEAFLADLYEKEIGIFREPVGGLDAVLASLPGELAALRREPLGSRHEFRRALATRIAEGRRAQHEGYDPMLDLRSAALPELGRLVEAGFRRLGIEAPANSVRGEDATQDGLRMLSRSLEEQLEEVCVEVGRRAGIEIDTDQNVHPFEVSFTLGSQMRIEALPGMEVPDEAVTHLGSFWRETAVARDELEWFATGHRLVEALVGLVRDGEEGRAAVLRVPGTPRSGALYTRWHTVWPVSADLAPGFRVPSRQASRYLDADPIVSVVDLAEGNRPMSALSDLVEGREDVEAVRLRTVPEISIDVAYRAAGESAQAELERRRGAAIAALAAQVGEEEERLIAAGSQAVTSARSRQRNHRVATEEALKRARVELDAVALLLPA